MLEIHLLVNRPKIVLNDKVNILKPHTWFILQKKHPIE